MSLRRSFRDDLIADLQVAHVPVRSGSGILRVAKDTLYALSTKHHFACVFYYRINVLLARRFPRLAEHMAVQRYFMFANDISHLAQIGPGLRIHHTSDIVIGRDVVIGRGAHIYNGVTIGSKSMDRSREMPRLGDNVLVGTGAKLLGKITIGDNVVIGALTFCDKDVPPNTVVVGNPMRFLPSTEPRPHL